MLLGIFIFLLIAYLRLSRYARERDLGIGERWLVALPLGPFLGGSRLPTPSASPPRPYVGDW